MTISRLTQRKCKATLFYISSWIITTLCAMLLFEYGLEKEICPSHVFFFIQLATFTGLAHAFYDVMILRDEMDHRPMLTALLMRSGYFLVAICANLALCILIWEIDKSHGLILERFQHHVIKAFKTPNCHLLIFALFLLGHQITFVRSVHKKFGTRVFFNTLLGKYQDPKEEDRIFMFIDMKRSTEIAEELGHVKYSSFVRDYYKLLSNCCEENHGEIYQIEGDGVFLTWKTKDCRRQARPLECFHDFEECLQRTRAKFMKLYGTSPTFKAAAHCGKVISTEVGNFGSEMAYHGDVLNTTSRIQALCSKLGQDFLISEDLFLKLPLPLPHDFICIKTGFFELKGKKNGILIFSLHRPLDMENK